MDREELIEALDKHKKWLKDENRGEKLVLRGANLRNTDLSFANLNSADLRDANLRGANLRGAHLRGANLSNANLRDVDLSGAYLCVAYLSGVDLSFANLRDVDLSFANLNSADLSLAHLSRADLSRADLRDVDLSGADLSGAHLRGANLTWAKTQNVIEQTVISVQVDTSRKNNEISYWVDLGVWTTGCFQGTLQELKESIEKTHKDNAFLRERYYRVIDFILNEANQDKVRR